MFLPLRFTMDGPLIYLRVLLLWFLRLAADGKDLPFACRRVTPMPSTIWAAVFTPVFGTGADALT